MKQAIEDKLSKSSKKRDRSTMANAMLDERNAALGSNHPVAQTGMITPSKSCKLDRNDVIEATKIDDKLLQRIQSGDLHVIEATKIDDKVLHRIESEDVAKATTNADVSTNVFHSFMGQYLRDLPDSASRSQVVDEIIATFKRKPLGAV